MTTTLTDHAAVTAREVVLPSSAPVPFVDLGIQQRRIADEVAGALDEVMRTTAFILGPQVSAFESAYAAYCGAAHCTGVGNGTDAIELALRGAGVGPGDEVIIPANTFVATAEAVARAGATLVLADCDEDFLIDPAAVDRARTMRTRAVIAVDLYGQLPRMEDVSAVAGPNILLFEDAAQSQGATRFGQRSGSFGTAAATSFYPGKNLGAYGDGGAVLTNEATVAATIRSLRNHGGERRYQHQLLGTNSRLDSIQAAVLSIKLTRLDEWNLERRVAADRYGQLLADVEEIIPPQVLPGNEHVFHLYVVRVTDRDRVLADLAHAGVHAGIHYPTPVHLLPAFSQLGHGAGSFPTAERLASQIISLPIFPGITAAQQERVAEVLIAAVRR